MLAQKEYEVITKMTPENIQQLAQQMEATQHDYGLGIFWQICQDEGAASGASSQEMQQLALQAL